MRKLPLFLSMLFLAGMLAGCGGEKPTAGRTGMPGESAAASVFSSGAVPAGTGSPSSSDAVESPAAAGTDAATAAPGADGTAAATSAPAGTAEPAPQATPNLEDESRQALDDLNQALKDLDEALKDADQTLSDIDSLDQ